MAGQPVDAGGAPGRFVGDQGPIVPVQDGAAASPGRFIPRCHDSQAGAFYTSQEQLQGRPHIFGGTPEAEESVMDAP